MGYEYCIPISYAYADVRVSLFNNIISYSIIKFAWKFQYNILKKSGSNQQYNELHYFFY